MEESSSNRKNAILAALKVAGILGSKTVYHGAVAILIVIMAIQFAASLHEVEALVEDGAVPKPLFTLVLCGAGLGVTAWLRK